MIFENDNVGDDFCPQDIDIPCTCCMVMDIYGGYFSSYQEVVTMKTKIK